MVPTRGPGLFALFPEAAPATIVDVGAAPTPAPPFYDALMKAGHAVIVGFDPDPTAFAELQRRNPPPHRCYPYCLGDGTETTFHPTTYGYTSSLLPINRTWVERFTNLPALTIAQPPVAVTTRRLDDVLPDAAVDMIKLDVQGAELNVLRGAPRLLASTLVVEAEVEFVPLYEGQPLFADVDAFMRAAGFQLHALRHMTNFLYTPVQNPNKRMDGLNQVVYADAVYVPDITTAIALPRVRLLKLAGLLHELYGSYDLALHLLKSLADRGDAEPFQRYAESLGLA